MSEDPLMSVLSAQQQNEQEPRRPRPLHISRSFSRLEPAGPSPLSRTRATTLHAGTIPEVLSPDKPDGDHRPEKDDIFVGGESNHHAAVDDDLVSSPTGSHLPGDGTDLPVELLSLSDRFVDSLSAKVHPTPPSIDRLSELFQEFYIRASATIATHISALSSMRRTEHPPTTTKGSTLSKLGGKHASTEEQTKSQEDPNASQQMLTSTEITDKRKARRRLEQKRIILEEAVERRVCENIYDRIWRHRSTQDEANDEKLRSRIAALSVVGIGLNDLGIEVGSAFGESGPEEKENKIRDDLARARDELAKMNQEKYPLGKLHHLTAVHKSIVETLSKSFPSSSSADEIMPTLIYTLITSPAEDLSVVSDLHFIQRFRSLSKMDGEAAYCLTNLEAAITFLETVDLPSLRAEEAYRVPSEPPGRLSTSKFEKSERTSLTQPSPSQLLPPATTPEVATPAPSGSSRPMRNSPLSEGASRTPTPQRRLSSLLQPGSNPFGAASDAVINTADQSFKNISNTLETSYKFLFGRLKEQQLTGANGENRSVFMPKTLDEARKLVSTPQLPAEEEGNLSAASSLLEQTDGLPGVGSSTFDGGNASFPDIHMARERSIDSRGSGGSGKKLPFSEELTESKERGFPNAGTRSAPPPSASANAAVESMRNLGNTLNPLNRLAGMSMMRGFGRTSSTTPPVLSSAAEKSKELGHQPPKGVAETGSLFETERDSPAASPLPQARPLPKVSPPIERFMEVSNPGELKIGEISELLRDYRRLAGVLKELGAV
ncbi:hypothetical protein L228DRAFT_282816 [Xylona heveae TC161]|uniref:VPS9 domain-containing protein n=1 Tax=Xylona heveae (strain CBS 132557 / TC161) TaxID=1328760 RepID=A0A165GXK3_XYLHT|nr:hypothetical protein L228DRAFT_282816 [Xylona heveae TC161]KZF22729.1 hypothetical protein L228DRAFT_282816 [Xylona heveae TC161]